jgi:transcriptional regulator GlxA family with amidase domain
MIRLRRDDFQNPQKLAALAKSANLSPEEFRREFESVVANEPPPLAIDDHGEAALHHT